MAENHPSNVVPTGGGNSKPAQDQSLDAASMLTTCRDQLMHGVSTVFAQNIRRANDELLKLTDVATNMKQQEIYFDAMKFLSNRAQQMLQQFRGAYIACFDSSIAALKAERLRPSRQGSAELRLLDDEEFEQDLALGKLSARATFNCSQHLIALDWRLAALIQVQRINQDENPLHPNILFSTLLQTLLDMSVERPLALALLQSFERHTAAELPGIYANLNQYLVESGILPTLPLAGTHQPPTGARATSPPHERDMARAGGTVIDAGGYPAATAPPRMAWDHSASMVAQGDVFSQLLQAFQSTSIVQSAGASWPEGSAPGPVAGGGSSTPAISLHQLIETLGKLQRGQTDADADLGALRIDDPDVNLLRQIRSTPMANRSHPMDAMTIDIVAMLFDVIFNDPDLSATMRAEIAKLQIPLLKVALLSKDFFSDRQHPARRLLNTIANSGIGRTENDDPRLSEQIRSIVETVVTGFDSDIEIFSTETSRLETFLREEEDRANGRAAQVVDQLKLDERGEIATSRGATELDLRLNRHQVPALIADFLNKHWRQVMVDTFIRAGDGSADWAESVKLMDELIWSVEPKLGAQERDRLLVLLPDLLKRLRGGLERVQLDGAWDDFFSELIRLHMAALRNETPPPAPTVDSPRMSDAPPPNVGAVIDVDRQSPGALQQEPAADQHLRLVQALEVGAWIEFQSARGTRNTLRLNWVSHLKRVYLFTNRQGENAMTLADTSLAEHLRKGSARLLSQNPLTDRAVSRVLEQARPGHLAASS
jgi:hypothetical protein